MIRITSDMYASSISGHEDPFNNGGRSHGLEVDITGITGGLGYMFSIKTQSALELNEFRPGADRDLSGLHFSGSGTASFHRFCDIRQASRFDCNTKVSRSSATTMASGAVFDGQGYNTLTLVLILRELQMSLQIYPALLRLIATLLLPKISQSISLLETTKRMAQLLR